jgi:RNA polymerase sigma factor (sigma-70 family)
MQSQPAKSITGELAPVAATREYAGEYRRLLAILALRARRLGSRDPEAAAQEAFKRSWENATSQPALAYYFSETLAAGSSTPAWSLDQLLSWLHAVLKYVVSEERSRVRYRLEVSLEENSEGWNGEGVAEPLHAGRDQLQVLMQQELEAIVSGCLPRLDSQYRAVLRMRTAGISYEEIASRLKVKENTVATWVSRAVRDVARCVKKRMYRRYQEG